MRTLRRSRGLSQAELAEALGITFQQIQKYERGSNRLSASRLFVAAHVLRVAPAALFEGMSVEDTPVSNPFRTLATMSEIGAGQGLLPGG